MDKIVITNWEFETQLEYLRFLIRNGYERGPRTELGGMKRRQHVFRQDGFITDQFIIEYNLMAPMRVDKDKNCADASASALFT